ncbi:hypothetical protein IWX90DRAFT_445254 [Phyllosticta citrichinensis]|uniref:Uncharacterized protein n=1 Tax=Phyllosticta citrichinensis TaxID=1130410 RepID=A0ABR1XFX0_9PEZI
MVSVVVRSSGATVASGRILTFGLNLNLNIFPTTPAATAAATTSATCGTTPPPWTWAWASRSATRTSIMAPMLLMGMSRAMILGMGGMAAGPAGLQLHLPMRMRRRVICRLALMRLAVVGRGGGRRRFWGRRLDRELVSRDSHAGFSVAFLVGGGGAFCCLTGVELARWILAAGGSRVVLPHSLSTALFCGIVNA